MVAWISERQDNRGYENKCVIGISVIVSCYVVLVYIKGSDCKLFRMKIQMESKQTNRWSIGTQAGPRRP